MANDQEIINETEISESVEQAQTENVGAVEQPAVNPAVQMQAQLEEQYKNVCAQEVALSEQLKQAQEQRKGLAKQLELVQSLAA